MRTLSVTRPNLSPSQPPSVGFAVCSSLHASEVRSCIGLTHANREVALTRRDARQEPFSLRVSSVAQEQWPGLAVCNPMRRNWSSGCEKLFEDGVPLNR
jgi:hypothetical protein